MRPALNELLQRKLNDAVERDDAKALAELLEQGASPDGFDPAGWGPSPLAQAASKGSLHCLRLLLTAGACVDAAGQFDPLLLAAKRGRTECVRELLDMDMSPLMWACLQGEAACAELLAPLCDLSEQESNRGMTALAWAVEAAPSSAPKRHSTRRRLSLPTRAGSSPSKPP